MRYGDAAMKMFSKGRRRVSGRLSVFAFVAALTVFVSNVARAEFPTLDVAIQRARAHALVVTEAESEMGVARAQMAGARASALGNPYTEIQVDRPWSNYDSAGREIQALTFTYFPIDLGGQRGKRIDEADRMIEWKKTGLVDAHAAATGGVVSAYGEYVVSWSRVETSNAGEATARDEAKYFQGRFEAKDTTLYEKSIAEAEVARWVQSRAEAELRVANSRARFGELTGASDPDKPSSNTSIAPPPLRSSWDDAHIARVVERAPAISRLSAEKAYWESSIERYRRERFPPLSLEVIAGRGSSGETRLGGGAVITFPITRRYQGEIARAEQGERSATRRHDLVRDIVSARLRAARDAIAAVSKAMDELDKSGIPALERAVLASMEGFRAGKVDLTRAMLARRDLAVARARRLDLLEAAWHAYADLVTFSGDLP